MKKDLFISYTHVDNAPWGPEKNCWISSFHEHLEKRLEQWLARPPVIWRDNKLKSTDKFGPEIVAQFPDTKVLLAVTSPKYYASEWCTKEREAFLEVLKESPELPIGNSSRLCKVGKMFISREDQPPEMTEALGMDFFEIDENGRPQEFAPYAASPYCTNYWQQLDNFAHDLASLLKRIDACESPSRSMPEEPAEPERTIFLAQTTSDLRSERESIIHELCGRDGFSIVPREFVPADEKFRDVVTNCVASCRLSIHLIGEKCGAIPEDETCSTIEIQHEVAADHARKGELTRLIWIPETIEPANSRQREFVDRIEQEAASEPRTQVHRARIGEFKNRIRDTLADLAKPAAEPAPEEGDPLWFYLICEYEDSKKADSFEDYLWDQGFEVKRSQFEGSAPELRALHQDYLRLCDVMCIFLCEDRRSWLETKLVDLKKAPGLGRERPIREKAVYLTGEPTPFKERFRSREVAVLKHFPEFSSSVLEPLVQDLVGKGGRSAP